MKKTHRKLLPWLLALFLLLSTAITAFAVGQAQQDSAAPVILHDPILYARKGEPLSIQATVTDDTAVTSVELYCRADATTRWRKVQMEAGEGGVYTAELNAYAMSTSKLEYYIQASDGTNVAAMEPVTILLDQQITILSLSTRVVTISEAAATPVTVIGEGFSRDMTVTVGGVNATYSYISQTMFLLTLPELGIGKADIVITSGENSCTRLEAITYTDPSAGVTVSYPAKLYIGQKVGFPVTISGSAPVTEAVMQFRLDPAYFTNVQFVLEPVHENVAAAFAISPEGLVTLRLTSADTLVSQGPIGYLTAQVAYVDQETTTTIAVEQASFYGVDVNRNSCDVSISNAIQVQLLNVPDTLYALEGQLPDIGGWELEVNYDGLTQRIPVTQDMVSISQENPGFGKVTYFHKEIPFTFQVLEKEFSQLIIKTPAEKLSYMPGEALDLTGLTLEVSYKDGQVVLPVTDYVVSGYDSAQAGTQALVLEAMGLQASMEIHVFQRGDINQDGKITLLDMVNVKSHVLGISILEEVEALAADFNGDGKISILDYVQIKAAVLGISTDDGE